MLRKLLRLFLYLVLIALGLSAGLGYGYLQLKKERAVLEAEIEEGEQKERLLQKKYTEKKAAADQLLRVKYNLEGQKRALQEEMEKTREEQADALKKGESRAAALTRESRKLRKELEVLAGRHVKLTRERDELAEKQKETRRTLERREGELAEARTELQETEAELKGVYGMLERCEDNNANLCLIAEELIGAYETKGVGEVILHKEPLTQIKRVELEHFAEAYRDRIEAQKASREVRD